MCEFDWGLLAQIIAAIFTAIAAIAAWSSAISSRKSAAAAIKSLEKENIELLEQNKILYRQMMPSFTLEVSLDSNSKDEVLLTLILQSVGGDTVFNSVNFKTSVNKDLLNSFKHRHHRGTYVKLHSELKFEVRLDKDELEEDNLVLGNLFVTQGRFEYVFNIHVPYPQVVHAQVLGPLIDRTNPLA